jgi:hypothetical protein
VCANVLKGDAMKKKTISNDFSTVTLLWMPSNETQDDGEAEDIQETAFAAFAASSQGCYKLISWPRKKNTQKKAY